MDLDDKEIAAMREMYRLLEPFDQQARIRIADYVGSRLEAEHWSEQSKRSDWLQKQLAAETSGGCFPKSSVLNYALGQLGR